MATKRKNGFQVEMCSAYADPTAWWLYSEVCKNESAFGDQSVKVSHTQTHDVVTGLTARDDTSAICGE